MVDLTTCATVLKHCAQKLNYRVSYKWSKVLFMSCGDTVIGIGFVFNAGLIAGICGFFYEYECGNTAKLLNSQSSL